LRPFKKGKKGKGKRGEKKGKKGKKRGKGECITVPKDAALSQLDFQ